MNLYSDFRGDSSFNIRALHRRTWINPLGGRVRHRARRSGTMQAIYAEFYQPLEPTQTWFVRPFGNASASNAPVFSAEQQLAVYRTYSSKAGVEAGANLGTWGQATVGYRAENAHAAVATGPALLTGSAGAHRRRQRGPQHRYARLRVLSHEGREDSTLDGFEATNTADNLAKYGTARGEVRRARCTLGDFIFLGTAEHGQSTHGALPLADVYSLGGPRHLAGFAQGQILGDDYSYGSLEAQYKLTRPIPLLGLSLIAGLQAETGKMGKPYTEQNLTGGRTPSARISRPTARSDPSISATPRHKNGDGGRWYFFLGTP